MATREIGGETFNIEIAGPAGAPVLMLSNSLSSNLHMWDPQVEHWAHRFRVIRYDSRGHGHSTAPEGPYSIAQLGQDALAIMDTLGLDSVHWCGLSKGGMVGMWLATHAPHRLNKVVLANTAARMAPPDLWNGRIATAGKGGMEALADATVQRWFSEGFRSRAAAEVERIKQMVLTTPVAGYQGCCAAIRDMDKREAIRAIERPVLVISGSVDPATPPEAGRLMHERIRGSRFELLEAAHLSNLERPDDFTRLVMNFLES